MDGNVEVGEMGVSTLIKKNIVRLEVTVERRFYLVMTKRGLKMSLPVDDAVFVKESQSRTDLSNIELHNLFR